MSRELTLIERMGIEFEEREGLFYPLVDGSVGNVMREVVNVLH